MSHIIIDLLIIVVNSMLLPWHVRQRSWILASGSYLVAVRRVVISKSAWVLSAKRWRWTRARRLENIIAGTILGPIWTFATFSNYTSARGEKEAKW